MIEEPYNSNYRWGFINGKAGSVTNNIKGTTLTPVFRTYRYGGNTMAYRIEVPNGTYKVKLMFAETKWKAIGKRAFNVAIEGVTVLGNHDDI